MSMPLNLVFVRHGESEGNLAASLIREGHEMPPSYYDTADWQYRLTEKGKEQAKMAGKVLIDMLGGPLEKFDERYVSSYIRARETAGNMGGPDCTWKVDDRIPERDWGQHNLLLPNGLDGQNTISDTHKKMNWLRWRPEGGESLMGEVYLRFRDWLDTLHREQSDKNVLAVAHGELIWMARYVIERMLPEEWNEAKEDKSQRIFNCDIIWYSRLDPTDDKKVSDHLEWRRFIRPTNQEESQFGSEWVKLDNKRRFSGQDLLEMAEKIPRIFTESQ